MEIIPRIESIATSGWMGLLLVAIMTLFLAAIATNRSHYKLIFRLFIHSRQRGLSYDDQVREIWADVFVILVAIIATALVIFVPLYNYGVKQWWWICAFALVIVVWYLFHIAVMKLIGRTFNITAKSDLIINLYTIALLIFGVANILISTTMIYYPATMMLPMIICAAAIYAFMMLVVAIKSIVILGGSVSHIFYIFLYLCSAEILPFLIVLKVAKQTLTIV